MAMTKTEKIWMNGQFVAWEDAKVHVLSHVLHYGSSVFEGIRAYRTTRGTAVFRLAEHMERLMQSAKIYRMKVPYTQSQLERAVLECIAINGLSECYIRPLIYRGYSHVGVNPIGTPIDVQLGTQATYDFWFQNKQTVAVEVGVEDKSCTCTNVQIGVVTPDGFNTPEDAKDFDRFAAVATAEGKASPHAGPRR